MKHFKRRTLRASPFFRPEPQPSTHADFVHSYGNSIGNGSVIPLEGGVPPSIFTLESGGSPAILTLKSGASPFIFTPRKISGPRKSTGPTPVKTPIKKLQKI